MKDKKIKEIIEDFCKNANEKWVGDDFDGGFLETTYENEDEWPDTPRNRILLIENYLLWYGYDGVPKYYLKEGESCKTIDEMINEYEQRTKQI